MSPQVYIFVGHSGAGKGTQGRLLEKTLKTLDPDRKVLYLETGARFREMVGGNGFTAKKTKKVMEDGKLPPSFLGIHAWAHFLIYEYDGERHLVIDGTPRVPDEVPILLSAASYYGWRPHVIFIDVSDEWASEKMKARGRGDDRSEQDIWGRVEWYHSSVIPTIELLRASPLVQFHHVSGEQTIEDVHKEVCREVDLL